MNDTIMMLLIKLYYIIAIANGELILLEFITKFIFFGSIYEFCAGGIVLELYMRIIFTRTHICVRMHTKFLKIKHK